MNPLQAKLDELASAFTSNVMDTIRGLSLDELTGGSASPTKSAAAAPKSKTVKSSGRLARRTPEDVAGFVDKIVAIVKKAPEGLRAEQIKTQLGLQAKEMPRLLKDAISGGKLRTKGHKRATTYFLKEPRKVKAAKE